MQSSMMSIRKEQCASILAHLNENGIGSWPDPIFQQVRKCSLGTRLTSTMTALYDVVEHNLYALFIQPFFFWESGSSLRDYIELFSYEHHSTLVSQAPFAERKGVVTLQHSSCHHDRTLMWPIRSVLFIACICVVEYNYITTCLVDVSILLSDHCVR